MFCIPKILKNESNSQLNASRRNTRESCFVSQRYWKMKAIHNSMEQQDLQKVVVLYPKDTEKWKQFTTLRSDINRDGKLFCIPKILKNESNSQPSKTLIIFSKSCFVSQRYWKMKAIHNYKVLDQFFRQVVLYPKDTEKWKQFTTTKFLIHLYQELFCIPKILKNESNSQPKENYDKKVNSCFVSQRYWKMKAIHNLEMYYTYILHVVLYPKDTEKWKQFTTEWSTIWCANKLFCIPKILKNESNSQLCA